MIERIGRYEILERVASGGQGTVYRARDTVLDRIVAVKVINQPVADDPAYLEALQREARLAASLSHPNIARVHDFQVEDGTPYIVMEFVPDALDRQIRSNERIHWRRAFEIGLQIARALQHAHDQGVVHRDIKPQNILIRETGAAAVSDFGIARALASSTRSQTGGVMGTPAYMAPEQWAGGAVDGRLDQYGLGIVLHEIITGRPPFQGDSMEALYVQHREAPVPPISSDLQVPKEVEDLIQKTLEKSPDDRYRSASELADVMENVLSGAASSGQRAAPVGGTPDPAPISATPSPAPPPTPPPPQGQTTSGAGSGRSRGRPNWAFLGGLGALAIVVIAVVVVVASGGGDENDRSNIPLGATLPTSTPMPTYTPYPTFTPMPTYTPVSSHTPPATQSKISPTPNPIPETPDAPSSLITIDPSRSAHRTIVNWTANGFSPDSPIYVVYGSEKIQVDTGISNFSGQASGSFSVPPDISSPSLNLVEVRDNAGNTSSLMHEIPQPILNTSSSIIPAGSLLVVNGRYFPPNRFVSNVTLNGQETKLKATSETNRLGEFELELWVPHQLSGVAVLDVWVNGLSEIVSAELDIDIGKRLSPSITIDQSQGLRNSVVKWEVMNTLADSPLKILYGAERILVADAISNPFGQSSGEFIVPADTPIPSENRVSAVEINNSSASTIHSVPEATIETTWSSVSAGSSIILVGKHFPQMELVEVVKIGDKSVLPNFQLITDQNGDFTLDTLVPHQTPGQKNIIVQVGSGPNSVSARTPLVVVQADPIPVGWDEIIWTAEPWEETGRSTDCPDGRCLRASNIPHNSYAEMYLTLLPESDNRFSPFMERTSISFEVKTSTEACCDILRVEHNGSIVKSWSGDTEWHQVEFQLSSVRPTMVTWIYEKDDRTNDGEDAVWVRNIQMK